MSKIEFTPDEVALCPERSDDERAIACVELLLQAPTNEWIRLFQPAFSCIERVVELAKLQVGK